MLAQKGGPKMSLQMGGPQAEYESLNRVRRAKMKRGGPVWRAGPVLDEQVIHTVGGGNDGVARSLWHSLSIRKGLHHQSVVQHAVSPGRVQRVPTLRELASRTGSQS